MARKTAIFCGVVRGGRPVPKIARPSAFVCSSGNGGSKPGDFLDRVQTRLKSPLIGILGAERCGLRFVLACGGGAIVGSGTVRAGGATVLQVRPSVPRT